MQPVDIFQTNNKPVFGNGRALEQFPRAQKIKAGAKPRFGNHEPPRPQRLPEDDCDPKTHSGSRQAVFHRKINVVKMFGMGRDHLFIFCSAGDYSAKIQ